MSKPNQDPIRQFEEERRDAAAAYKNDNDWGKLSSQWLERAFRHKYMYNFAWLGRPIIQLPADMVAFQEIVWNVRPDLIIETGIAHGGSLILSASLLAMLDYADAAKQNTTLDPKNPKRRVLGIDIDIRAHNLAAMQAHPFIGSIDMIEGSSIAEETLQKVRKAAANYKKVLVCLDSMHTHDHVFSELKAYAPMVSKGSYCLTFDTIVEDLPNDVFPDRPWSHGDNPKTAVHAYLQELKKNPVKGSDGQPLNFEIDKTMEDKLLLSASPDGLLKRI